MVRARLLAAIVCVTTAAIVPSPAALAGGTTTVTYRPPVEGEVVDGFRPPASLYGSGNRGLDYETASGTPVHASAGGQVVFAGLVAGSRHVTILHPDGLRTSYSFLASIDVVRGTTVGSGAKVGTSTGRLHFGVRDGDRYLDPATVFAAPRLQPRLVPDPPATGAGTRREGLALLPVALDAALGLGGLAPFAHYAVELNPAVRQARMANRFGAWWEDREDCTPAERLAEAPSERRIVVLVGGLGTTSERSSVDRVETRALGYGDVDVLRFSYAGGRTPGRPPDGPLAALAASPYSSDTSQQDLLVSAGHLQLLLADVAARQPGVPIDVIAHSQGGVVAQLASSALVGGELPTEVDLVATIGSPHDGADIATAIAAVSTTERGRETLAWLEARLGLGLDPQGLSVAQLSESSRLMAYLGDERPPDDIRMLSIGARGDLTVPANHTYRPGATQYTIDLMGRDAHTLLPGDPATTRELALALEGHPPTCETAVDVLTDLGVSEGISYAEDLAALTAALLIT